MRFTPRKALRLGDYDYTYGWFFVTICARDRAPLFGAIRDAVLAPTEVGRIVTDTWAAIPAHFPHVALDAFVLMPNHLHGIVCFDDARFSVTRPSPVSTGALGTVIRSFKAAATRAARSPRALWQRGYYEHVIRNEEGLNAIRAYIAENPARWATDRENPERRAADAFDAWLEAQGRTRLARPAERPPT